MRNVIVNVNGTKFTLVDSESAKIVLPSYEWWMWNYLKPKSGDVFLDVGAHIGKYTLQVARMVGGDGVVIAVEPSSENYEVLMRNLQMNRLENVITYNVAGWNKNSRMGMFLANFRGQHSLKINHGLGSVEVEAMPLDNVVDRKVDWIKVDVEKAELEVFEGLRETLRRWKPKVIVEVWKENVKRFKEFMNQLGYEMMSITQSDSESRVCFYCYPLQKEAKNIQ